MPAFPHPPLAGPPPKRPAAPVLMIVALLMALAGCLLHPASAADAAAVGVLPRLDLSRYAGTWYELARAPNEVQRGCVADVVTRYRLDTGALRMEGECRRSDGSTQPLRGLARPQSPGAARLQQSFLPAWLRWLPGSWKDYWVVALDPGYRIAAVSDREGALLWVLSREPRVEPEGYAALMAHLRGRGFAVEGLQPTLQLATVRPGMKAAVWAMR